MSDNVTALFRTFVPAAIGSLVALLAGWGVEIDAGTQTALTAAAVGVVTSVWWAIGRWLETRDGVLKHLAYIFIGVPKSDGATYQ